MPLSAGYITNRGVTPKRGRRVTPAALCAQVWTNPLAAATNGLSTSHTGAAAASTRDMTLNGSLVSGGIGKFDFPRNVVITVTHGSAVIAMNGVISGYDLVGRPMTEAWSVTAGGTTKTFTGKKAFAQVTGITETVAADASTDTVIAGSGTIFGLDNPCSVASGVKETSAGSVVTNGTIVKASAVSTDDPHGTYSPSSAPNGSTTYELWYISNQPESGR